MSEYDPTPKTRMIPVESPLDCERALLIITPVQCACGHHWTESNLIFKGDGYSYHLTKARYYALHNRSLTIEGKRVHPRITPVCHECCAPARDGWADAGTLDNPNPHYPYEQWPDKHKEKLRKRANRVPDPTPEEISAKVDSLFDDI